MIQHVWLARHGRTSSNASGRYLGASDDDLDDVGVQHARQLATWAIQHDIRAILTSPARRACHTASIVGRKIGIGPRIDDRLRELDFGVAEGRTLAELREEDAELVARFEADPVRYHFAGGEDPRDAVTRMRSVVADILELNTGRPLVVTHNTLLRLFVCDLLNAPLQQYRRLLPIAEHCAITEVSLNDGKLALWRFNARVSV